MCVWKAGRRGVLFETLIRTVAAVCFILAATRPQVPGLIEGTALEDVDMIPYDDYLARPAPATLSRLGLLQCALLTR